jgi:hypothetical protein
MYVVGQHYQFGRIELKFVRETECYFWFEKIYPARGFVKIHRNNKQNQ